MSGDETKAAPQVAPGEPLPDGCRLPGDGGLSRLAISLVALAIWLVVLLPFAICWTVLARLVRLVAPSKPARMPPAPTSAIPAEPVPPPAARKYDLVLLGATGFTGGLAAKYMARQYGNSVQWAIAGRSVSKLEAVREELCQIDPALAELPLIKANADSEAELTELARSTKAVASTVGPFARYGSMLVAVCATNGTHYADITGEIAWVRQMIDMHDDTARSTGARIVHCCGHDCIPWDLITMMLADGLKANGDELSSISCYDEIRSAPSGGTIETLFASLERPVQHRAALGFDPLLKTVDGSKGVSVRDQLAKFLSYSSEFGAWCGPFVMALCNINAVRRSGAVLGYSGAPFSYHEAKVYPSFKAGLVDLISMLYFGTAMALPPLKYVLRKTLPSPGQGPSAASMAKGFLKVTAFGRGCGGARGQASIFFPTDPGYVDTARMLIESGLLLAEAQSKTSKGGVWTPACGLGRPLLERLVATGCTVSEFETPKLKNGTKISSKAD